MPGMTLLNSIKRYLRVDGSEDDMLLASLISAAKQYLLNAGVREPDEEADDGKLSLYELAVSLYVSLVYDGDNPADQRLRRR